VFRLTQEEYTSLKEACRAKGGRNVSEFTRSELMTLLTADAVAHPFEIRLAALEEGLRRLERILAELTANLAVGDPPAERLTTK
jgi:hypothetical protein